jgi:SAM-dependent methyltransferase
VELEDLEVEEDSRLHGKRYQASNYFLIRTALNSLSRLGIGLKDINILDLGSGKGRSLILFAERQVLSAVGVEVSAQLNQIAEKNIQIWKSNNPDNKTNFQLVSMDAGIFEIPTDTNLIYLSNPFDEVVMNKVIENIKASMRKVPRPLYVLYMVPVHKDIFEDPSFVEIYKFKSDFILYKVNDVV